MICKNCGYQFESKFCPECGQNSSVARFNLPYLFKKILGSFDIDRGFFHAVISLLYRPGQIIRDYVEGKRINLYDPFKLFLITGAIATLIIFRFGLFREATDEAGSIGYLNLPDQAGFFYYSGTY